jgi:RHS repeat-associated protein
MIIISPNLWNGNIRHMVVSIRQFMSGGTAPPQAFAYKYDQLNRITGAELYTNFDLATNAWQAGGSGSSTYRESFTYDHNGNIIRQNRNGSAAQVNLDQLKYYYYNAAGGTYDPEISTPQNATNRLAYVTDGVAAGNYGDDIDNQSANNYTYDQIGQLTGDAQEQIGSIVWNVYNKIRSVTRTTGSTKADLEFKYDAMGQRMVKIAKPRTGGSASTQENWVYTYYVRDAQGNVMATYERKLPKTGGTYKDQIKLKEQHLYGSSRAGMRQVDLLLTAKDYTFNSYNGLLLSGTNTAQVSNPASQTSFVRMVGQKVYEMANHLGNVLVTVTDGRFVLNSGSAVTGYTAVVKSAMDYSAFGAPLAGRTFSSPSYKYGFNGMEKDAEMHGVDGDSYDFGARMYDARVGRWLSCDPLEGKYPDISPYTFAIDNPLKFIDFDGRDITPTRIEEYAYEENIIGLVGQRDINDQLLRQPNSVHGLGVTFVRFNDRSSAGINYKYNEKTKKYDVFYTTHRYVNKSLAKGGELDKLNPGLAAEVEAHEQGHVQQLDEVVKGVYTIASGFTFSQKDDKGKTIETAVSFTGTADQILDQAAAFYDKNPSLFAKQKMTKQQYLDYVFNQTTSAMATRKQQQATPNSVSSDRSPAETDANKRAEKILKSKGLPMVYNSGQRVINLGGNKKVFYRQIELTRKK